MNSFKNICIWILFLIFFTYTWVNAVVENSEIEENLISLENTLKNYWVSYKKDIYIENPFIVDISSLQDILIENFPFIELEYEWIVPENEVQTSNTLNVTFDTIGNKNISLNIYATQEDIRKRVYSSNLNVFIYKQSLPIVMSKDVAIELKNEFINSATSLGVYLELIGSYDESTISESEIIGKIQEYKVSFPENSDYLVIWWEKEFLFSALSALQKYNSQNTNLEKMNIVLLSSYNKRILESYITNALIWKDFLKLGFILDEAHRTQILKNPWSIERLEQNLISNAYEIQHISEVRNISPLFFVSKFINQMTQNGIPHSEIIIFLMIPLFLTWIGASKHIIGINSLWIIIPLFLSILFIQFWLIFTLILFFWILFTNIILGSLLTRFTLLYIPKIIFVTLINIISFIFLFQLWVFFEIIDITILNILHITLFYIISERLLSIIVSKELQEYRSSISWTLIVSLICFWMSQIDTMRIILLAYPEVILITLPLNFYIASFTGLRITEYFRFREIIHNIEE